MNYIALTLILQFFRQSFSQYFIVHLKTRVKSLYFNSLLPLRVLIRALLSNYTTYTYVRIIQFSFNENCFCRNLDFSKSCYLFAVLKDFARLDLKYINAAKHSLLTVNFLTKALVKRLMIVNDSRC